MRAGRATAAQQRDLAATEFLMRRRGGGPLDASNVHRGEREIIARN
jgi:hypothetical protein